MTRTLIIGPPQAGKTTLALEMGERLGVRVRHTDDLIGRFDWSGASEHIARVWLAEPGPWIIEGVAVVRALRKWLDSNRTGSPCETIILLDAPRVRLSSGQASMQKACATIWSQIERQVRARGVVRSPSAVDRRHRSDQGRRACAARTR
jgi:adenylate kinase family enzyme